MNPPLQHKNQKRLLVLTIVAVCVFIFIWSPLYLVVWQIDPNESQGNFSTPALVALILTFISMLICYFTAGLTILNWRRLPNKKLNVVVLLLSLGLILFVLFFVLQMLRQR